MGIFTGRGIFGMGIYRVYSGYIFRMGMYRVYSGYATMKYTRFGGFFGKGILRVYFLFGGYIPDEGMWRV